MDKDVEHSNGILLSHDEILPFMTTWMDLHLNISLGSKCVLDVIACWIIDLTLGFLKAALILHGKNVLSLFSS